MIQISGGGKHFGSQTLFENLDWLVTPQDRVGIVGGNGTGKSTLLKLLAGMESLDHGSVVRAKGISIGYLPQEGLQLAGRTLFRECLAVFDRLHEMEREMHELAGKMGELDAGSALYEQVAERFHQLESQFVAHDGYALEAKVGTVLTGLQFPKETWEQPCEHFSGGWQMRIALAKLLLEQPNLLLMDEPTNHLDLEARNWLEGYLAEYPFAYILVSHDRYFLDVTVKKIIEIWHKRVHFYPGNYDKYKRQKAERLAQITAAHNNQRAKIEQLEIFINRFRYKASKAKQVQSRIKELERMEKVDPPPPEEKAIHFTFPSPKQSGRVVAEFKGVAKNYGAKQVFAGVTFTIERGDKIALVGVNGAGKSTLLKVLAGVEPLTAGGYTLGINVMLQHFAQDQYRELDPAARLIDDLSSAAPNRSTGELRGLLGCFLFSEDDVYKKMAVLSGGEKNRYALCRLLLEPANFLLLDEPTNHLDMRAKDVLLEALQQYSGTVIFVSHDRYFLDQLATRVFEVAEGEVRIYPGNYEDYLWRIGAQTRSLDAGPSVPAEPTLEDVPMLSRGGKPRVNPIKLRQMRDRQSQIERETAELEAEIAGHEHELASYRGAEESRRRAEAIEQARAALEKLTAEWEEVTAAIEATR
jgi:ATP-binding cassette subfamily F protein 3